MVLKKWKHAVLAGLAALALLGGVATASFAQTDTPAVPETTVPEAGRNGQALADALGITLEALQAARKEARNAMIDQAVAGGRLTAEEGEALKASAGGLGRGLGGGRGGYGRWGYDQNEYLAAALGISLDELEAAKLAVYKQEVAERVAAGELTQEQADLLVAGKAAGYYLDTDALNAQVRSAYETAIAAAVAAGDISQAQADALLAELATMTFNFGFGGPGGRGGHGGHGRGHGPGGMRGLGSPGTLMPETTPETTPSTTDTAFDA